MYFSQDGLEGQNVVGGTQARKHRDLVPKSDLGQNLTLLHSGPQVPYLKVKDLDPMIKLEEKGENVK